MHTYTEVGVFYAKVTVSDGKGGKDTALLQVAVQPVGDNEERSASVASCPASCRSTSPARRTSGCSCPGVTRDYTASLAATATSTATAAELTVRDPSATATGHLVNGTHALAQPVQVRATDAANPDSAFAPVPENGTRLRAAGAAGAGERASDDARLQAVDRGDRVADHRRLRQDAGVHALGDHAVSTTPPAPGGLTQRRPPAGRVRGMGLVSRSQVVDWAASRPPCSFCGRASPTCASSSSSPRCRRSAPGIQIAPNAVRLLQRLGLWRRAAGGRRPVRGARGSSGAGRTGACCSRSRSAPRARRASARRTSPSTARSCCEVLADALPDGVVALGRRVTGVDGASLVFEDGSPSRST